MKKRVYLFFILGLLLILSFFYISNRTNKITKITIARFTNIVDDKSVNKFNEYLKSKNLPYEIEFLQYMELDIGNNGLQYVSNYKPGSYMGYVERDKDKIDLFITNNSFESDFNYMDMIYRDLAEPLDDFIQGDGSIIYDSIPKESWDSIKINRKLYSIPMYIGNNLITNSNYYYGIKKEYADKYNIDISTWGNDFWNHKDELNKIIQGESSNEQFSLFNASLFSSITEIYPGLTPVTSTTSVINPYVYDEENKRVINIYESEPIIKMYTYFKELYSQGSINFNYDPSNEGNILELINPNEDYYIKEAKSYLRKASNYDIAVCKESKNKEEIYEFLKLIYTDKDTIKAIEECFATNGVILGNGYLNKFVFNEVDTENLKIEYSKLNKSDIYGFIFDCSNVEKEMTDIATYLYEINRINKEPLIVSMNLEECNSNLHKLGINKVLDEMNKQIGDFLKTKNE